jgi:tight adherence protein C
VAAIPWLITASSGGSAFFLFIGLAEATRRPAWSTLIDDDPERPAQVRAARVWPGRVLGSLGRTRAGNWLGPGTRTARRLELAGGPVPIDVFRGIQLAAGGSCGLLLAVIGATFPPAFLLAPVAGLAGIRVPEIALARRARRRQSRIADAVPDLVELLLATTEAGLSPSIALRRCADVLRGPLGEEIRSSVGLIELGTAWHRAMEMLVDRTDVGSLRALVIALNRSQRLGSGVGVTLRRLVDDLRSERRLRAEEAARKAPLKMLFPLVFLVLPAFLLLTVGPVVLATIRSLR